MTGLHAALAALAEKWETEAAHPTGHSLLVQAYGNLAREVRALLAEHPATPGMETAPTRGAVEPPDQPAAGLPQGTPADLPVATDSTTASGWMREEHERAKARNAETPPHAQPVVTGAAANFVERCPKCRHAPHGKLGFCPNMASDNDCSCTYAAPEPTNSTAAAFCTSRHPEPPHQRCEQGAGHDGRHRDFPADPRVAETYWTDAPPPEPSDQTLRDQLLVWAEARLRELPSPRTPVALGQARLLLALLVVIGGAPAAAEYVDLTSVTDEELAAAAAPEPSDRAGLSEGEVRAQVKEHVIRCRAEREYGESSDEAFASNDALWLLQALDDTRARLAVAEQERDEAQAEFRLWSDIATDEQAARQAAEQERDRLHEVVKMRDEIRADLRARIDDAAQEANTLRIKNQRLTEISDLGAQERDRLRAQVADLAGTLDRWLTAPSATRDNGLMLPGDRETWRVREIRDSAIRAARAALGDPEPWVDRLKTEAAATELNDLADAIDNGDVDHESLRLAGVDEHAPLGWADASVIAAYDVASVWTSLLRERARVLRDGGDHG